MVIPRNTSSSVWHAAICRRRSSSARSTASRCRLAPCSAPSFASAAAISCCRARTRSPTGSTARRSRRCSTSTTAAGTTTASRSGLFISCSASRRGARRRLVPPSFPPLRRRIEGPRAALIDQAARDLRGSPDRFGYEWGAYAEIRPEYEEQFRRWTVHLAPRDWTGRSFLDVGCGMGRNSFWPMTYGACEGCAVDIDERSLASARRNLARFPAIEVMRSIAFDQMLPRIAHYWPRERVAELMTEAGLEDVRIASVNGMSWSAIGARPLGRSEINRS